MKHLLSQIHGIHLEFNKIKPKKNISPVLKRIGLMMLVLFGPGFLIFFISKTISNEFIQLPYLGEHEYIQDENGKIVDSVMYTVPNFKLKKLSGETITRKDIDKQFIVLTTLQNSCPDSCGVYMFHFETLFYKKLVKNQSNYSNVKIISILTDIDGNPVDTVTPKFTESTKHIDENIWWITTGDPKQLFDFRYYGNSFYDLPSTPDNYELGQKAFVNSLILIDKEGHIRGVTGARRDSDIRNFFDLLKILKKVEFDANRKK